MAATVRDVAEAVGVSPSTVSRALSVPELVNPATRARVLDAARRLGYAPNRAARGLITGRTGNVGLVVPDLANPFFAAVAKGVQARAREADYHVFVADTDEDVTAEADLVRTMAKQVDGVLLCSPRMSEDDLRGTTADTTVVLVNRRAGRQPAVVFDNADGMHQAMGHLGALGHRRVAWVGGPRTSWSNRERQRAVRAAAQDSEMELVEVGNFTPQFDGGVVAADLVLAAGVTAVIAFNDLMALGILGRLHARGTSVPEQVSVLGIDDIPMSGMASPPLTTVALPTQEAGRRGVELLLSLLEKPEQPAAQLRRELPCHLLVRGSSGVARNR